MTIWLVIAQPGPSGTPNTSTPCRRPALEHGEVGLARAVSRAVEVQPEVVKHKKGASVRGVDAAAGAVRALVRCSRARSDVHPDNVHEDGRQPQQLILAQEGPAGVPARIWSSAGDLVKTASGRHEAPDCSGCDTELGQAGQR